MNQAQIYNPTYNPTYNQYQNNRNVTPNGYNQTRMNRNASAGHLDHQQLQYQAQYQSPEQVMPRRETPNAYRDQLDKAVYGDQPIYNNIPEQYQAVHPQKAVTIQETYGAPEQYNGKPEYVSNQRVDSRQGRGRSQGYGLEQMSTPQQQPNVYDQLANQIKTNGYRQQNLKVWDIYQRAYEEKEKQMVEFEENVVERAAREKIIRDEKRMKAEWEKKQQMEKVTFDSNRRNLAMMVDEKRKQKQWDLLQDNQRVQDSLAKFEREDQIKKEIMEKMKRENNMILDIQRRDFSAHRPNRKNVPRDPSNLLRHSLDKPVYPQEMPMGGHVRNSMTQLKERPDGGINQSSMMAKIADMSLKDPYYREEDNAQRYVKDVAPIRQSEGNYVDRPFGMSRNANAKDEYVKIRDRVRFGAAFNIITNEQKGN